LAYGDVLLNRIAHEFDWRFTLSFGNGSRLFEER
jgi:hypothetical protein